MKPLIKKTNDFSQTRKIINMGLGSLILASFTFLTQPVKADLNLAQDIRALELNQEDVVPNAYSKKAKTEADIIYGLSYGIAPSREGLPSRDTQPSIDDLIESAYNTTSLIKKALEDSRTLPTGEKIRHFEASVVQVLAKSGSNPAEQAVRIILNRSVDVISGVIAIAGQNPDVIAQFAANFYDKAFQLALSYANNPICIASVANQATISDSILSKPLSQVGYEFMTLMWRNQSTMLSGSAKSILLIKTMSYMGWDLNNDLRRREQGLAETTVDIYKIQKSDRAYAGILSALERDQEPSQADIASLRVKVYQIWKNLPERLKTAGVLVIPKQR